MTSASTQAGSGLALIDKPAGITSHDVVSKLRKVLGTRRVGHAGTLDPMATGLLVIGVNAGTKLLNYLTGANKTYLATIRLGWATTTDDAEGERLADRTSVDRELAGIDEQSVIAELRQFMGQQQQIPSSVSAIRIDGKRAYDLVRSGVEVELKPRTVELFDIRLLSELRRNSQPASLDFDVTVSCSSGTYIRAIARDLGNVFGVGGHLTSLRRVQVGPFSLEDACDLTKPELIPLATAASMLMPVTHVTDLEAAELRLGRKLAGSGDSHDGEFMAAIGEAGTLVAVVQPVSGSLQPRWVLTEGS